MKLTNRPLPPALLLSAAMLAACGDDGVAVDDGDESTSTGDSTVTMTTMSPTTMTTMSTMSTTVDPDSTSGDTGDTEDTTGDTTGTTGTSTGDDDDDDDDETTTDTGDTDTDTTDTGETETGTESTTGDPDMCGNNMIDGTEVCDGMDLGGEDCVSQGFTEGSLGCAMDCMAYDTSGCSGACGNNMIDGTEVCDGIDLGGNDCVAEGFDGGTLLCQADCSGVDTLLCSNLGCIEEDLMSAVGAAVTTGDTTMEDEDLVQTCAGGGAVDYVVQWTAPATGSYTFDTFGSGYDTALSMHTTCGAPDVICNDDAGGGAQSEISSFAVADQTFIFAISGFDGATGAFVFNITQDDAGPCCAAVGEAGCSDTDCAYQVCTQDLSCCTNAWTTDCADLANSVCDICNTADVCGNGVLEMGETCDGTDVGGETCATQGFTAGVLSCAADCTGVDTDGCIDYVGDCCVDNGDAGCDDGECVDTVCAAQPFCCDVTWDGICAQQALDECAVCEVCGDGFVTGDEVCDGADLGTASCVAEGFIGGTLACDGASMCTALDTTACVASGGGDCCNPNGSVGCDDLTCTLDVCAQDSSCCDTDWAQGCADLADLVCTTCGGGPVCSNCSFESGDFTDWDTEDLLSPFFPLAVDGAGGSAFGGFFEFAPSDGLFSARHGFDGDGATSPSGEITISQQVDLPAGASAATLSFDHRHAWDLTFGATMDREFIVRIEDMAGTELDSQVFVTATAMTTNLDTGTVTDTYDLTAYVGQTIRFVFVWTVPEDFVGPGQAELDGVGVLVTP